MKILFKLIVILLLFFRLFSADYSLPEGERVQIKGRIQREVITYDYYQRVNIIGNDIYIDKYPLLEYGDLVIVQGRVVDGELKDAVLVDHQRGGGVYRLRSQILSNIQSALPTKDAALVSGVLLGAKKLLTEKFSQELVDSGTIHVVVASGTNVTLTAAFLISVFVMFMRRKVAIMLAIVGIWLYVTLSGFDPPLIRAAIMGSIAFSAQGFGRVNDAINALVLSVIIMIFINPIWISDVGFQLSFLATLSLILFESFIYNKVSFVPSVIRQDLSTSLAAQIGVAPLLLYYFGRLNIISPLVNMLVLWTIPPIMVIGFVVSVLSLFYQPFSMLYIVVMPFTQTFIFIVNIFS